MTHHTRIPNVDVVPASPWLVGAETLLRTAFASLPARWDCPPLLGLLASAAFVMCQSLLIPVETRVMALSRLTALLPTMERVRERLNPDLSLVGIVPCRVDLRTNLLRAIVQRLRERFGDLIFDSTIRENVRLAEASKFETGSGRARCLNEHRSSPPSQRNRVRRDHARNRPLASSAGSTAIPALAAGRRRHEGGAARRLWTSNIVQHRLEQRIS
jgi:chromosome partitioning protein